ncbi:probable pathogenesis-related protein CaO19.6200 [Prosopis cineraria]|uniref:probable pathogenesis-related protein CaO19.6200 n=1 Tax=Prosopis cineraria TaxID=364024 RepID=UPI0024101275|nr:probable pathogenesis-related protein CaO19.6200 [Prosopis cineraria]
MHQNPLIAAIFLLFLAQGVSGLPISMAMRRHHGGHYRFRHRRPTVRSTTLISIGQGKSPVRQGTPAAPQIPVTVPTPTIPRIPVAVPPPSTPQTPVTVPAQPTPPPPPPPLAVGTGDISDHAKKFGWDPLKVIKGCGANCDLLKYLRKEEFLVAHNWVRVLFKLPLFTWDEKLENVAKQYAMQHYDDCKMVHSDLPYGENIFWGLRLHWTPSDAVYYWLEESKWYNFTNLQCTAPPGKDCGHFTQLVWKDSLRLGCALQHCRDPTKGMLVVCEYDPPGSYDNENPLDDNNAKHQT